MDVHVQAAADRSGTDAAAAAALNQIEAAQHVGEGGAQTDDLVLLREDASLQVVHAAGERGLLRFEHLVWGRNEWRFNWLVFAVASSMVFQQAK